MHKCARSSVQAHKVRECRVLSHADRREESRTNSQTQARSHTPPSTLGARPCKSRAQSGAVGPEWHRAAQSKAERRRAGQSGYRCALRRAKSARAAQTAQSREPKRLDGGRRTTSSIQVCIDYPYSSFSNTTSNTKYQYHLFLFKKPQIPV